MNVYFFQKGDGATSLWADCTSTASVAATIDKANLLSSALEDYPIRYNLFDHVENRHVLFNLPQDPTTFILKHPLDEFGITEMIFNIRDLARATSYVNKDTSIVYGSMYGDGKMTKEDAAKNASFYGRTDDGNILNLITQKLHTEDVTLIPWFFCFKVKNSPIYYIVPNPNTVQITQLIENEDDPENRVFNLDSHMGPFNRIIFSPEVNREAKVINGTNIMVSGNKLSINPFGGWFAKSKLPGFFDPREVKCTSSYKFVKDEKGIHFDINSPHGYIIIRWNTISAMDYKFMRSNRFYREFVVTQIKE